MATLTLDTKNSATLTADSRSADGSLTTDSKNTSQLYLWASYTYPWDASYYPWVDVFGSFLTLDTKN